MKVRVKVIEPGIQSRWCDRCGTYRYFSLDPVTDARLAGALRLRWLTSTEVAAYLETLEVFTIEDVIGMVNNKEGTQ